MAIHRHVRRASSRRALTVLTAAIVAALLAAPATAATAATVSAPAPTASTLSAPAALTSTPLLAAVSTAKRKAAKRKWGRRRQAVRFARSQLGKPYRWGGTGPAGYDCSGLTLSSWKKGSKSLPHSSRMQFTRTKRVTRKQRRIGDLQFYGNPVHHVTIYVGNGKMIEAPSRGKKVRKVSANRKGLRKIGRPH